VRLLRQIASEFSNFAGEPTPRFSAVSPHEMVEEIIRPYMASAEWRAGITRDVPQSLPNAWADRTLVARALTNVVENAVQAMPQGGTLRVTGISDDAHVILTFVDSGVGMDAEGVSRAFEPYFSTKTAGSGLGLANAKRNLERCGGTITLESAPGRGTNVRVTLPRADRTGGIGSTPSQ
jgi:signal transduction histidine kinase